MLNFENLGKANYLAFNKLGIPDIPAVSPETIEQIPEFIPFNYAKSCKDAGGKGAHFFIDDYQFTRLWTDIDRYVSVLQRFECVMSPDFSTYTDMPVIVQMYNHYRKHWVGRYLSERGINVIPTISWAGADSYDWCFEGEPENSVVAVSSVGCMRDAVSKELFYKGFEEMKKRLSPAAILCYGAEIEGTVHIPPYYEKIKEKRIEKNGR